MARGDRGGGDGGGGGRGGGKGGKGPKPQFTRVIPKFLQGYTAMLTGSRPGALQGEGVEEETSSGGGEVVGRGGGVGGGSSASGMPGKGARGLISEEGNGGGEGAGHGGGGGFDDYDEEEVAALEEYIKTHPSKAEDREALRRRAKELSTSIGGDKTASEPKSDERIIKEMKSAPKFLEGESGRGAQESSTTQPEPEREYTDASGKLKFNKRASGERDAGDKEWKKKDKKARLGKLAKPNTKLLSFGDDEG